MQGQGKLDFIFGALKQFRLGFQLPWNIMHFYNLFQQESYDYEDTVV